MNPSGTSSRQPSRGGRDIAAIRPAVSPTHVTISSSPVDDAADFFCDVCSNWDDVGDLVEDRACTVRYRPGIGAMFAGGSRHCYSGGLSVGVVKSAVLDDGTAIFQGQLELPRDMRPIKA